MSQKIQPIIIGEVLFDLFEDGQAVLGGAPFNVAWHLQGFGQAPIFISRIGQDSLGEQIRNTMLQWGMPIDGLQVDPQHATGIVRIKLANGQPTFDICDDVAYDYIDLAELEPGLLPNPVPLLYHGSLAARTSRVSSHILQIQNTAEISFVDINLRTPWWDNSGVSHLIHGANWLKVNDDELITLTGAKDELSAMTTAAKKLIQDNDIDTIILTRGEQGALIITRDKVHQTAPVPVNNLQDTVGAGDAFSAVCLLGIIHNWSHETILQRATEFAARICEQRGATSPNIELYHSCKAQWQLT